MSSPLLTFPSLIILFLFIIPHSYTQSLPPPPLNPITLVAASSVCQNTLYPGYCRNVLQSNNTTATVYDYGRFSFNQSVSQANKFLRLIDKYLSLSSKLGLTPVAIGALRDCQLMAQLNIDFLTSSYSTVQSTSKTLPSVTSDDVSTLLSGVLTNHQTCLDGLKSASSSWSVHSGLTSPLSDDCKLYSVSLALFNKAWATSMKPDGSQSGLGRKHSAFHHGRLQKLMYSAQARLGTRKLVEKVSNKDNDNDDDEVLIDDIVTVSKDGTGNFTSIKDAVLAAPNKTDGSEGYFLIYVSAGVYEEYVDVSKHKRYIMMIGDGINQTIITGNRSFVDNIPTFKTCTFAVVGTGFVGVNMTIRNTAGAIKHQAVALRNGADLSTFYSCSFEGYQDTLYVHSLRQFYRECDIYGTIDFIFGNAAVVLQNCNIYVRLPMNKQKNAITAQGRTDPFQTTGISIQNCTIRPTDDLANSNGTTKTYLGRPWKLYSRTIYLNSYIDSLIDPVGWTTWGDNTSALETLYYGEFNNTGPGSDTSKRVPWLGYHILNFTEALNFTVSTFILGPDWLPKTGVSYASGLI